MDVLLFLVVVGGGLLGLGIFVVHRIVIYADSSSREEMAQKAAFAARAEEIRQRSEGRAIELMVEFPGVDDVGIATLMRDELVNIRASDRRYFDWANPETVGRIRRTLVVSALRASRTIEEK